MSTVMNCDFLHEFEGLKFMPVTAQKRPIIKNWQRSTEKHDLSRCEGVGLVCGALSGGIEVVDVDMKYSLDGKLFDNYKSLIHASDKELLQRLLVETSMSGGYHLIYRCSVVAGNQKLASRLATEDERKKTYDEAYQAALLDPKNKSDEEAKSKAKKEYDNDKVRVLLETRGEGGYIMCYPSSGYKFINRDFYGVMEITPEQREILHSCARQLNEVFEEVIVPKTQVQKVKGTGKSAFDDYNERVDIIQLLTNNGWKYVKTRGSKIHFQRPGQTSAETSGNFDTNNGWFSVFSTSTDFEVGHGYRPYAVFAKLECNNDFSEASRRLYQMGYGDRQEAPEKEKAPSTRVIPSRVNVEDGDNSFLAAPSDYDHYLQQVIDGTLPIGITTGSPLLDEHFLLKQGCFVMDNGHDNTGKSVWVWWLILIATLYHDWEPIIYSSENSTGGLMRKLIQFYWGKPLRGFNAQTPQEYSIAKKFIERKFHLIKAEEELYNYKDILNMVKKTRKIFPKSNVAMIDPYNSLKTDLSGFSKLSTHDYHYEALSELKAYGQHNNFGWFINHHAVTESLRKLDSEGYPIAPHKADTEGGGKVANKADDFFTVHRKVQHPVDWNITEIHIRKIKDTETGGKPTPINAPVRFKMIKNQSAFEEVREDGIPPVDPIARWHQTQEAIKNNQPEHKHWADRDDHQTLEQFKEQGFKRHFKTEVIATIPANKIQGHEDYVPDDEEKAELEKLLKEKTPF